LQRVLSSWFVGNNQTEPQSRLEHDLPDQSAAIGKSHSSASQLANCYFHLSVKALRFGPVKTMKKLGVCVVGVGEMGKRHAENLRRHVPEAQLVAIADVSVQRVQQVAAELEIEHAYTSIEEAIDRKDVRAVVIATPDKFHAGVVQAAAAAGKDILCEKPLAITLDDAQSALEAVRRAGVRLQVGFMRRYDPAYVAATQAVGSR